MTLKQLRGIKTRMDCAQAMLRHAREDLTLILEVVYADVGQAEEAATKESFNPETAEHLKLAAGYLESAHRMALDAAGWVAP